MKYCEYCGKIVDDDGKYCPYCGGKATEKNVLPQYVQVADSVIEEPVKRKNGFAIAGFCCAPFIPVLGFVFGGLGLGFSKKLKSGKGLSIAAIVIAAIALIAYNVLYFLYFYEDETYNFIAQTIARNLF